MQEPKPRLPLAVPSFDAMLNDDALFSVTVMGEAVPNLETPLEKVNDSPVTAATELAEIGAVTFAVAASGGSSAPPPPPPHATSMADAATNENTPKPSFLNFNSLMVHAKRRRLATGETTSFV